MKYNAAAAKSTITTSKPSREIIYYFRTEKDLAPKLVYANHPRLKNHPVMTRDKQVALNLSFLPTFGDSAARQPGQMVIVQDRTPVYD